MSYDTMLTEGSQDAIKRTDKHGWDFSRAECDHCGGMGNVNFNMSMVATPYGERTVHHVCEMEYLKIIAE